MRVVVFAYHALGCLGLRKLLSHDFDVGHVFTHPDSDSERIWWPSVAKLAEENGLRCTLVENASEACVEDLLTAERPDFIFSFYFRRLLSERSLKAAQVAALNLHGSLLPAYRGCAPVNWALIKGEKRTGVTLHLMVSSPDAGPVLDREPVEILEGDTAFLLYQKLLPAADRLLDRSLPLLRSGSWRATEQDLAEGGYFPRRRPADGEICWNRPAQEIYNLIRALTHPYPGAFTFTRKHRLRVWWGQPSELATNLPPGTIAAIDRHGILVSTSDSSLRIVVAQRDDEPEQPACAAAELWRLSAGDRLGQNGDI